MKKYLTFLIPSVRLISVFFFLLTLSCGEKEPNPKSICKLLSVNEDSYVKTYQYDEKSQLIRRVSRLENDMFTYDEKGFLTEITFTGGGKSKFIYTDGLLTRINHLSNSYTIYEYDSKKNLISKTNFSSTGEKTITKYLNGKEVAYIFERTDGTIIQSRQYENGRIIRDGSRDNYFTYEYDEHGRLKLRSYYINGVKSSYTEYNYEDGKSYEDAEPTNLFKGFPKVIDEYGTKGVLKSAASFIKNNNVFFKYTESSYVNEFNNKRYLTASTVTGSSRSSPTAIWTVKNPTRYTYAYINCGD